MNCNDIVFSKKILLKEGALYKIFPASIEISGNQIINVTKLSLESYQDSIRKETEINRRNIHDFGDRLITPAFINCHTHIAMNFFRSFYHHNSKSKNLIEDFFYKAESALTPQDVQAFARIGAFENILNGNGLIWDHYYHGEEIAKACQAVGITAVIAPTIQDISGPGVVLNQKMLEQTVNIHSNTNFEKSGIFAAFGPHATDTVSKEMWLNILNLSHELNLPIHTHVSQSLEEVTRIYKKFKKTPVQFLDSLGITKNPASNLFVHCIYLNKNDLKILQGKNNALVFCPFSQLIFQSPANVLDWDKNKIKWFIATDCVASNDSMNLQKELKLVAGFPKFQASLNLNAKLMNKYSEKNQKQFIKDNNEIRKSYKKFSEPNFLLNKIFEGPGTFHNNFKAGIIQNGSLANLIVWDVTHPAMWPAENLSKILAMGDTTSAIYNMMLAGKWISKNGDFVNGILQSDLYKMSLNEANIRLKHLIQKL